MSLGEFVDIVEKTSGAFKRSSAALCLVVALVFLMIILSTSYHILAYASPAATQVFLREPEVQKYENSLNKVEQMDAGARVGYYWSHNLEVAGLYVATTPTYSSFHFLMYNWYTGMNLSYWYHRGGAGAFLAFLATVFVHGVFELTGIFIIVAITLRAAWVLWKGLGHLMAVGQRMRKRKRWGLSEEWKEIRKFKGEIMNLGLDFIVMVLFGAFLIFLAAPIEAYISPWAYAYFLQMPWLAIAFLAAVAFFYIFISVQGFGPLRKNARTTYGDLKLALKLKWHPTQLSFFMSVICFAAVLIKFFG